MLIPEAVEFFEGKISEDDYLKSLVRINKWKLSLNKLKEIIRENFNEIKGTRKIIEILKQRGYKLGLLSVHGREWIEYCENKFDYHKLFDSVVYSFEIAICKPNKEAYLEILNRIKIKADECLFVDDMAENVVAAREVGIKALLFTSSDQLKLDLISLGIKL